MPVTVRTWPGTRGCHPPRACDHTGRSSETTPSPPSHPRGSWRLNPGAGSCRSPIPPPPSARSFLQGPLQGRLPERLWGRCRWAQLPPGCCLLGPSVPPHSPQEVQGLRHLSVLRRENPGRCSGTIRNHGHCRFLLEITGQTGLLEAGPWWQVTGVLAVVGGSIVSPCQC